MTISLDEGRFGLRDAAEASPDNGAPLADEWDATGAVDALVVQILTHAADTGGLLLPESLQAAVTDALEVLPVGADASRLLAVLDPAWLSADCLLAALRAGERAASWAQAAVVGHTARFAAPGVGVPVRQLVDALRHGTGGYRIVGPDPLARDDDTNPGAGADGDTNANAGVSRDTNADADADCARTDTDAARVATLLTDPVWGPALAAEAQRLAAPEIAAALTLSPITAGKRIAEAIDFTTELAPTWHAWRHGRIDRSRAWTIADTTAGLPAGLRSRVQERVLPRTAGLTPGRLRALTDRVTIEIDPAAARDRLEEAKTRRQVTFKALRDGLARLAADLPADQALIGYRLIDDLAETLPDAPDDHRGIAERRADVLADLLTTLATQGHLDLRTRIPGDQGPGHQGPGHQNPADQTPSDQGPGQHNPADQTPSDQGPGQHNPAEHNPGQGAGDRTPDTAAPDEDPASDRGPHATSTSTSTGAETCCRHCGQRLPGTGSTRSWRRRRGPVHVDVVIAASTLAGLDEQPAHLAGYGAITADLARALTASAATIRAAVQHTRADRPDHGTATGTPPTGHESGQPRAPGRGMHTPDGGGCGTPLDYGRAVYRPPAALDRHIRDRDQTCRFPGCRQAAWRCDLDHREPFAGGGATCPCNLDALCRTHHRAKTFTSWTAIRTADGALHWRSPHGHTASTPPDHHPTDTTPDRSPLPDRSPAHDRPPDPGRRPLPDEPPDPDRPPLPDEPPPF